MLTSRLPGLDGLRAIACLMVFAVHFGQISKLDGVMGPFDLGQLLKNGNSGVALFFSLSGFLLSIPWWNALSNDSAFQGTMDYVAKRAARLVPAYFVCLTTLIVVNQQWNEKDWLFDAGMHYAFAFNYTEATIFSINPPFWTIAVEAQFYVLLPLLFFGIRRIRKATAPMLIVALSLAAYGLHLGLVSTFDVGNGQMARISPVLTYSLLAHLPHFLFGVLTAWIYVEHPSTRKPQSGTLATSREIGLWAACILLIVFLGTPLDGLLQFPYGRYNLPFVPLLMCTVIMLTPNTVTGRMLFDSVPFRAVGAVSYGVYIYHLPALHVVARHMARYGMNPETHWMWFGTTSLGVTLVVAALSYVVVEKPVLALAKRERNRWRSS